MDVPLIVALVTFLVVLLASSAVFLYFNSREALQTWRRRADGTSGAAESEAAPAGMVDQLTAQLYALLEWFGRMNQPSNVEDSSRDASPIDQRGLSIWESPSVFRRRQALVGHRHRLPIGDDSCKGIGISERFRISHFIMSWLQLVAIMLQHTGCEGPLPLARMRCSGPFRMHWI